MSEEGKGIEITIAILAAVAVLGLGGLYIKHIREKAREKTITNGLRNIAPASQQYILEEGPTPTKETAHVK
ncbi:hypothetical protein [Cerasicoccus maritimus]|uniref:hypothetical protein n=1 Tax=Cerasicoccus maritimus TaxID=490089 RepID=UPI0028529135|nr:hypothetical protein [Cerasicoccus maritimus]